jgi:flagellar FliJ protein
VKRFKFRLQTVLEQRERIETQAKTSYGEAQRALVKGQQLLKELQDVRDALIKELSDLRLSGQFNADDARVYQDYIQTVTKCMKDQVESVRHLTTTAEAFRLHLVGAAQKRQIVDKIKERDRESHHLEGIRVEQAESDELSNTRFHYNHARAQKHA